MKSCYECRLKKICKMHTKDATDFYLSLDDPDRDLLLEAIAEVCKFYEKPKQD